MLELKNVGISFESGSFNVLNDISFSVEDGKIACILGLSGSGKTVLLYSIAGFLTPTTGEILCNERRILEPDKNKMMVFQQSLLFPWKTVMQNVLLPLLNTPISSAEKNEIALSYLKLVGIDMFKDWYPYKLSGGMQQRVALARALVTAPDILLLDEPFSALDSQYRNYLRNTLEQIWTETKKTIIYVTHNIDEALSLADVIYVLSARPATIKSVYEIGISRPRDLSRDELSSVKEQIDSDLREEFKKVINNPEDQQQLSTIFALTDFK